MEEKNENVFYTAIFGNKIPIDNPGFFEKIPGWDYILFTNFDPSLFKTSWTIIQIDKQFNCNSLSARNIKWCRHSTLDHYKKFIWIDAYIKFKDNPLTLYNLMSKYNKNIIFKKHPARTCIYKECDEVVRARKDTLKNVLINKNIFINEKMPKNYGLMETNIIVYNNDNNVKDIMKKVFDFMVEKSYRDQLSLTYIIWKNSFKDFMVLEYKYMENFIIGKPPINHTPQAYKS